MRKMFALLLLYLGFAAPALAAYPGNQIQWRPADPGVKYGTPWGYDANGDIACPTEDGHSCIFSQDIARAREARGTLSCGSQHRALLGHSGYEQAGHWCRELALRHGNSEGFQWRAPTNGVPFYWRRNPVTGNLECASDGSNCFWWNNSLEAAFKRASVVACRPEQYGQAGHWCSKLASERRNNGYAWTQNLRYFPGRAKEEAVQDMYFSFNQNGDIQCPSNDGRNCYWPRTRAEAEAARRPLACGSDHLSKYGITGYDTTGHWCRTLALAHGNAKGFWYRWGLIGLVDGVTVQGQEVMCASRDGRNCGWSLPLSSTFKSAMPLICGRDHRSKSGIDGYDTGGHWCRNFAADDVRGSRIRIQNPSGEFARVCKPVALRGADRDETRTDIRCTDLHAGNATAVNVASADAKVSDVTVCVEVPGKRVAGLFFAAGGEAQISIDGASPGPVTFGTSLTDLTGAGSTNCREAYAFFSDLER